MNHLSKPQAVMLMMAVFLIGVLLSVFIGPGGFSVQELSAVLCFRVPRTVIGVLAGGVLAVVGGALQGVMRNPLVDPWTLGVASGAALGVTVAIVLGWQSNVIMPVMGFAGGALATVVVYILARGKERLSITRLVLAGVIVNFFFSSLVILLIVLSRHTLGEAIYLMMGYLGLTFTRKAMWLLLGSGLIALVGCSWLIFHSRELDIISLDEDVALSLGVDAERFSREIVLISSVAVGIVVAWTGVISFVGLVVPHLVRMLLGPRHSDVLAGSFILGAGILLLADVLVRVLTPAGLPLSVITALIGVPFFIYLLRKSS